MNDRRTFLKSAAAASAASTLASYSAAAEPSPGERVRVGLIGLGVRGYELHQGLLKSSHATVAGVADLSEHYIDRIGPKLADPKTPIHRDYRALLDDKTIDAVVIATPDFWHAKMAIDAMDAGKDVYVEKPLAWSHEEAVQVKNKARESGRVTQVGYQRRSIPHFYEARDLVQSGALGQITHIQLWLSRNRGFGPWRTYNNYATPGLPEKSKAEHIDWERYLAIRPKAPFDPRRFFGWQCYREYSTGIFGILMSHPLDAANLLLGLDIPATCSATGGIFVYDDGRSVPDTCSALFSYPQRKLTISFLGMNNNSFNNQEAQYSGTNGTMELGASWLRVYSEAHNALFEKYVPSPRADEFRDLRAQPIYNLRPSGADSTLAHLDDFFVNVKQRGRCHCPVEEAYKAMVAVAMALKAYDSQRTVRWDEAQGQIIA
jgi:predicted dehydrogenase